MMWATPAAFRRQVEAIVRSDDLVIGLSTSGRSPNVIEAIRAARQIGARTVAFLGEQGELADIADIAICIPSTSVPRIQEAHMFIGHLICEMAQRMTTGEYQTRFVPCSACLRRSSTQGLYGGLRATDVAQCSEADQPGHDQVDSDEVIEKAWKNQNENPHDECYEG